MCKHNWIVLYHSFDLIEHDQPYTVYYCACGQRKTEILTPEEIEAVCHEQGWNPQVLAGGGES